MTYVSKRKPRVKQAEGLKRSGGREAFALLMAMRCVDGDTEYLAPGGWRKISAYVGGKVAEFRLDGTAHFVDPINYIKSPVDRFWHFKTSGGVDQVLSQDHRILLCSSKRATFGKLVGEVPAGFRSFEKDNTAYWRETSPREIVSRNRFKDHVPTTFDMRVSTSIPLSEIHIRLMVAFHADGSFGIRDLSRITPRRNGHVRVKKRYKKERMRSLLSASGIEWREDLVADNFSVFVFKPPMVSKTYGRMWWDADRHQREIIADEACRWDGRTLHHRSGARKYASVHESDVDFIQYCFVSTGIRASKSSSRQSDGTFTLLITGHGRTNNLALLPPANQYTGPTDGMMYSFEVPSSYLVLRRNGKVFVTGNTGKTKVVLDDFGQLEAKGKARQLLVVAPAGAYDTWPGAALDDFSDDLYGRTKIILWKSGGFESKKKKQQLADFLAYDGPKILSVNAEALSRVKQARQLCIDFLSLGKSYFAIDESVIIKNPGAEVTKFVNRELRGLASFRRILTGLVTPRSPLDLYTQFEFLDPKILGFKSYYAFRNRFAVVVMEKYGGRFVPIVKGYRDVDKLNKLIAPYSFRVTLADCYDLPPKIYTIRHVELTDEQRRVYDEIKEFATARLPELIDGKTQHVTATVVIAQIMRMHQVLCGHSRDEEGNFHTIPENRTKSLVDFLQETEGKVIIWCSYDHDVRKIAEGLRREFDDDGPGFGSPKRPDYDWSTGCVARFWGGNRDTRMDEESRFKNEPACRFMIATPDAGGRARTWVVADTVVYYSCKNNLDHRDQSEERAQGVDKINSVLYVDMITPDTVEEKILKALRDKINMSTLINGDNWRSWVV